MQLHIFLPQYEMIAFIVMGNMKKSKGYATKISYFHGERMIFLNGSYGAALKANKNKAVEAAWAVQRRGKQDIILQRGHAGEALLECGKKCRSMESYGNSSFVRNAASIPAPCMRREYVPCKPILCNILDVILCYNEGCEQFCGHAKWRFPYAVFCTESR